MTLLIYGIKPLRSISHPPSCIVPKVHCTVLVAHMVGSDPFDYMNDYMYDYMKGSLTVSVGIRFPTRSFHERFYGFQYQKEKI